MYLSWNAKVEEKKSTLFIAGKKAFYETMEKWGHGAAF